MTPNLTRMRGFIKLFDTQRSAKIARRIELMKHFITEYSRFQEATVNRYGATFNIFGILNIGSDEVRHSAVLAWLLDEKAGHHQGNLFFNAFLESCSIDLPLKAPRGYVVRREFPGMEAIIDISVFHRSEFLIYVENKVSAEEGVEQCARELRDMHRLGSRLDIPPERQFAVFLTPDGRNPVTGDPTRWIALSYQQLGDVFRQLMPQITSDKVCFALEDWLEIISNFGRE